MAHTVRIAFLAAALVVLGAPGAAEAGKPQPTHFYFYAIGGRGLGLEGFGPQRVVIARTGNVNKKVSVTLTPTQITDGDAQAGVDFDPTPFLLTFGRNVYSREVWVPFIDDTTAEPDEKFRLELSAPSVGTVEPAATATIFDDDQSGLFTVPDGSTFSYSGRLNTCHQTSAAVVTLSGDPLASLGTGGATPDGDCSGTGPRGDWTNDTGSPVVVRIALTDQDCADGYVYYSDHTGTGVAGASEAGVFDHAAVWRDVWSSDVLILDSGDSCSYATSNRQPSAIEPGYLRLTVVVTPLV